MSAEIVEKPRSSSTSSNCKGGFTIEQNCKKIERRRERETGY